MGILDSLTNLSPEQTQGLLAFAANTLQGANTGRPMSFGGALGGGIQAYQQSIDAQKRKKIEEEQAAQIAKLTGLKIQDAESDLTNQQTLRDRAEQLRQFYIKQSGAQPQQGAIQTAPAMGNSLSPTIENAARMQSMAPPQAQAGGSSQSGSLYHQRLAQAQALRNAGFGPEADATEAAALKFQPKVKEWQKVQDGGRVLYAPYFEDGTSGAPVPLEVAEKLEKINTGGTTQLANPYTGATVRSLQNTQSPDSAAQVAATIRGQNLNNARGIEANAIARDRASSEKAPTEFQGKSAAYGLRATEADKILTGLSNKYSPGLINSKSQVANWPLIGGALGAATNYALSDNDQIAEQAQRDFINATLRQESGAAIGKDEFDNARKQYFPQPGDSEAVIRNKATNRQLVIQGFNNSSGRAKMTAPARASSGGGWSIQKVD